MIRFPNCTQPIRFVNELTLIRFSYGLLERVGNISWRMIVQYHHYANKVARKIPVKIVKTAYNFRIAVYVK